MIPSGAFSRIHYKSIEKPILILEVSLFIASLLALL